MNDVQEAVRFERVNKWFGRLHVLRDIDLSVRAGERIVICGPSGSGKSTLIRCVNRLEKHQQGRLLVNGVELTDDRKRTERIRREVGMVFQHFELFPHLTVLENCTLAPIHVRGMGRAEAEALAMEYLARVRIPDKAHSYPGQLSGGQQQRVAIARALINDPPVLLADEPTGALDSRTGEEILALFKRLRDEGHTVVLITHDAHVAAHADRICVMRDGQLHEATHEELKA